MLYPALEIEGEMKCMEGVLVLVANYPDDNGKIAMKYVHIRNLYYKKNGIKVTVLNFNAKNDYEYEGIKVISLKTYYRNRQTYKNSILILHAANIRNHFLFLIKNGTNFERFIFFYHGHEVLKTKDTYPEPYYYIHQKGRLYKGLVNVYDNIKLFIWKRYLPSIVEKSDFIFVSKWMLDKFVKYTNLSKEKLKHCYIIPNSIGKVFEENNYDFSMKKKYDFVTIRGNLDGSKYCMDIVNSLAKYNKENSFLVIGKGKFFSYYKKAENITWIDKNLSHEEIIEVLNLAKCALMPTRLDAQGVMMCEMASFGIPVITSDIDICQEIKANYSNMYLIDNSNCDIDLAKYLQVALKKSNVGKKKPFTMAETVGREIQIIKNKALGEKR